MVWQGELGVQYSWREEVYPGGALIVKRLRSDSLQDDGVFSHDMLNPGCAMQNHPGIRRQELYIVIPLMVVIPRNYMEFGINHI